MAGSKPSILVVADQSDERALIVSVLGEAGFVTVAAADRRGATVALRRERFAAILVALAGAAGSELVEAARRLQRRVPVLLLQEPTALPVAGDGDAVMVNRPLDPRLMLECVFEAVLRDAGRGRPARRHGAAAESGIAAAKLACLYQRHAVACAAGARRLAHDLARQIGETRALRHDLSTAAGGAGFAREALAGAA